MATRDNIEYLAYAPESGTEALNPIQEGFCRFEKDLKFHYMA